MPASFLVVDGGPIQGPSALPLDMLVFFNKIILAFRLSTYIDAFSAAIAFSLESHHEKEER